MGSGEVLERCELTGRPFQIMPGEREWYRRFGLPLPRISPTERYRRQLAFRSGGRFFWRESSRTGERIFSVYPRSVPFPVVEPELWGEEVLRCCPKGLPVDENVDFIEQLKRLWEMVPRRAAVFEQCPRAVAVQDCFFCPDGYRLLDCHRAESCLYSVGLRDSQSCADCLSCSDCVACYECVLCRGCFRLRYSIECRNCRNSWFLRGCENCEDCLLCVGLEGARHCVLNEQLTEDAYEATLRKWQLGNREMLSLAKTRFAEITKSGGERGVQPPEGTRVSGVTIECWDSRDLLWCSFLSRAEDCLDGSGYGEGLQAAAQFVGVGYGAANVRNSVSCYHDVENLDYCFHCRESRDLLGCIGLSGRQYCILNREYSRREYGEIRNALVARLEQQGKWGAYLPPFFSEFSYASSLAGDLLRLNSAQIQILGYLPDQGEEEIRPSQLLDLGEAPVGETYGELPPVIVPEELEELARELFLCEITGRPYRLIPAELKLYAELGVPPPARMFEQRHAERLSAASFFVVSR